MSMSKDHRLASDVSNGLAACGVVLASASVLVNLVAVVEIVLFRQARFQARRIILCLTVVSLVFSVNLLVLMSNELSVGGFLNSVDSFCAVNAFGIGEMWALTLGNLLLVLYTLVAVKFHRGSVSRPLEALAYMFLFFAGGTIAEVFATRCQTDCPTHDSDDSTCRGLFLHFDIAWFGPMAAIWVASGIVFFKIKQQDARLSRLRQEKKPFQSKVERLNRERLVDHRTEILQQTVRPLLPLTVVFGLVSLAVMAGTVIRATHRQGTSFDLVVLLVWTILSGWGLAQGLAYLLVDKDARDHLHLNTMALQARRWWHRNKGRVWFGGVSAKEYERDEADGQVLLHDDNVEAEGDDVGERPSSPRRPTRFTTDYLQFRDEDEDDDDETEDEDNIEGQGGVVVDVDAGVLPSDTGYAT